jgi:hypothetical protein
MFYVTIFFVVICVAIAILYLQEEFAHDHYNNLRSKMARTERMREIYLESYGLGMIVFRGPRREQQPYEEEFLPGVDVYFMDDSLRFEELHVQLDDIDPRFYEQRPFGWGEV